MEDNEHWSSKPRQPAGQLLVAKRSRGESAYITKPTRRGSRSTNFLLHIVGLLGWNSYGQSFSARANPRLGAIVSAHSQGFLARSRFWPGVVRCIRWSGNVCELASVCYGGRNWNTGCHRQYCGSCLTGSWIL